MSVNLKPCPFCGSHNISVVYCYEKREKHSAFTEYKNLFYVECDYCRVRTDSYSVRFDAVTAWETRS